MVKLLQGGLSAGAQLAAIDRVKRIAFDLLGSSFTDPDQDAATRRTLSAGAGIEIGQTRDRTVLRWHEEGDQFLVTLFAAGQRYAGCGHAGQFQESTTFHSTIPIWFHPEFPGGN